MIALAKGVFAGAFRGVCRGATVSRAAPYMAAGPWHAVGDHLVEGTITRPSD